MKPISKKVIEAGLVDAHTLKLMQRWGYLDPETPGIQVPTFDKAKEELQKGLTQFVEELDELIEAKQEEEIKETRFSITLRQPERVQWLSEKYGNRSVYGDIFIVFHDESGNLIFPANANPYVDREFVSGREWYRVTSSTPLWYGDTLYAHQVTAELFR